MSSHSDYQDAHSIFNTEIISSEKNPRDRIFELGPVNIQPVHISTAILIDVHI